MEINFELLDLLLISPAIVLFLASLIPLTIKVLRGNTEQPPFATLVYAFIGLVSAAGLTVSTFNLEKMAFANALSFDGLSSWASLIIILIVAFCLLFSRENLATCTNQFSEYVFLVLNSAVGMMIVAWSNDLIITFIGIEIMSLCLYILIALSNEETFSKEAAFKYFVLGSFGSAVFLYGVAYLYGSADTLYINKLLEVASELASTNRLFLIGSALTIIGFCFKVGLAPFHAWSPDVYQGSPTPVTAYMASGVKVVTFVAFLRLVGTEVLVSENSIDLVTVLQWIAVASILLGNITAIMQTNMKRLLAYSSIAHSGYVLIGIIAASVGGQSLLGASGTIFYMFAYTIMTLGTFGFVCLFESKADSSLSVEDLKGLGQRNPWMAFCFTLLLLSLAGIPPLLGFFGKFFIFSAAIKQGFFWLAFWGVIGSVISVYYYLRPVVYMYMTDEKAADVIESKQLSHFSVGLMASLVLIIGFAVDPFYRFVVKSVSGLF